MPADDDKAKRLAEALRANLKRRKDQARQTTPRETQNSEPKKPAAE